MSLKPALARIHVKAWYPRPTETGVENGIDVNVDVTINGNMHSGTVTLIPDKPVSA